MNELVLWLQLYNPQAIDIDLHSIYHMEFLQMVSHTDLFMDLS